MTDDKDRHAEILLQMRKEWLADDAMSEAMLDLAVRVKAARQSGGDDQ